MVAVISQMGLPLQYIKRWALREDDRVDAVNHLRSAITLTQESEEANFSRRTSSI